MSTAKVNNLNLVHESETQRQYARVKLPATVRIMKDNKKDELYRLYDISAGGFSINASPLGFIPGEKSRGQLLFTIDGFKFLLDVEFQIIHVSNTNNRVGFQLHNISQKTASALRYVITSFLSGELISTQDMIATIARENYTSSRNKVSTSNGRSFFRKFVAGIATLFMLIIGLVAALFVATQLYNIVFVVQSKNATVETTTYEVEMPKAGGFKSLVRIGDEVQAGQPIGTLSMPILGYIGGSTTENIDVDDIRNLATQNVTGSLSSPCNCIVAKLHPNSEFVSSGEPVILLQDRTSKPKVTALFDIKDAKDLKQGDVLMVQALGTDYSFQARIEGMAVVRDENRFNNKIVNVSLMPTESVDVKYREWPMSASKNALDLPKYSF